MNEEVFKIICRALYPDCRFYGNYAMLTSPLPVAFRNSLTGLADAYTPGYGWLDANTGVASKFAKALKKIHDKERKINDNE